MIHIGLACSYHDPAIAVISDDGEILFAEAAERSLQTKRAFHCPPDHFPYIDSVLDRYCPDGGHDLVISKSWGRGQNYWHRLEYALNTITATPEGSSRSVAPESGRNRFLAMGQFASITFAGENLRYRYARRYPQRQVTIQHHEHHLTHAAAACYTSPFDEAVCAVIDGYGEDSSTAFYHFAEGRLTPLDADQASRNSLGHFYNRLCNACGFDSDKGDQWQVMGLAATGEVDPELYSVLCGTLVVNGLELSGREKMRACPVWNEPMRSPRANLARTGQIVFEETMIALLRNLREHGLSNNLVLTGGCALNSSCNGKILEATGFSRLYVPFAPADDGNAIGAAFLSYLATGRRLPRRAWQSPYLGSVLPGAALADVSRFGHRGTVFQHSAGIEQVAAQALAEGKLVGWAQDAAEFGPRALGNRSILGNPTLPRTAARLRSEIKLREQFRPFAPSILHEYGDTYFESYEESPYMERTLRFKPAVMADVPAVVHSDGTGRLQTVRREWNPKFYSLISCFHDLTGVPLVLNTSMNVSGRPIVHSVEDAIAMFYTTGLDLLVVGDCCIRK